MGGPGGSRTSRGAAPLILVLLVAAPAAASAQSKAVCLLPDPLPACRSFPLIEAAGWSPVVHRSRDVVTEGTHSGTGEPVYEAIPTRELSHAFGWSVGWALNLAPEWAAGLEVGYAFGEGSRRRALGLRVRRWLHSDVALDLAPGIFSLSETGYEPDADRLGYKIGLRASLWDVGFLGVRYDALPLDARVTESEGVRRTDPGGVESTWSATAGLEGGVGVLGTAAGVLAILVALGVALGGVA